MNDQVHVAAVIEKTFQHKAVASWQATQCLQGGIEILGQLRRGGFTDALGNPQPLQGIAPIIADNLLGLFTQA